MNAQTSHYAISRRRPGRFFFETRPVGVTVLFLAALGAPRVAPADSFASVRYRASADELVVTMLYRGTNPNHTFSLQWGSCKGGKTGGTHEIEATVLDGQWRDAAQRNFKKTTHISLSNFNCRPALLTLRTAPHFAYTIQIPVRKT
jgi:hypothetical protein